MTTPEITPQLASREHDVLRATVSRLVELQREFEENRVRAILRHAA